jgi:hypothetical protein
MGFQESLQTLQARLELHQFLVEIRSETAPRSSLPVAVPRAVQVEIGAVDSVFIEVDAVYPTHPHEARATGLAWPFLEKVSVRFDIPSVSLLTALAALAARSTGDTSGRARS